MAASPARPPITCHILDTTTGSPAPNVQCTLTLISDLGSAPEQSASSYSALTNDDGRVTAWTPAEGTALEDLLDKSRETHWRITFEIGQYWRTKSVTSFFNKVDIHFVTGGPGQEGREHYHVPLLVGPYNYTTYRGS